MEVLQGPSASARLDGPSVTTVGVFDGVHLGHRAVLGRAVRAARDGGLSAVAVTFDRHPLEVVDPPRRPPLITSLDRKAELIASIGLDVLVVLRFDDELASWPAERFAQRILRDDVRAARVVVGENFTFGRRALGTVATLEELGPSLGFAAEGVPLVVLDGRRVSSTSIREALTVGELSWPRRALGRPFAVDGRVVAGAGRGAGLGFPTANLEVPPGMLLPGRGVYAGRAHVDGGQTHPAAINVGTNPTFGGEPVHVEAFLLDFEGDLRGRAVAVEFVERLRDEERFDSAPALVEQIRADVERARAIIGATDRGSDGDPGLGEGSVAGPEDPGR
jgi:riboflavin kinase/FMN adenylyltransferase